MYEFLKYTGATSTGGEKCAAESVVLQLAKHVPMHKLYPLFLTNGFLP